MKSGRVGAELKTDYGLLPWSPPTGLCFHKEGIEGAQVSDEN